MNKWALLWGWCWSGQVERCIVDRGKKKGYRTSLGKHEEQDSSWLPEPLGLSRDWRPPIPPGKGPSVTSYVMLWHTRLLVRRAEQVRNKAPGGILLWENNPWQGGVILFTTPVLNIFYSPYMSWSVLFLLYHSSLQTMQMCNLWIYDRWF